MTDKAESTTSNIESKPKALKKTLSFYVPAFFKPLRFWSRSSERELRAAEFTTVNEQRSNLPFVRDRAKAQRLVMQARAITKSFGGNRVLDNLSFKLHRGEIVLLRGDNGTGKTTLINILTGNLEPDFGAIKIQANGKPEYFEFPPHGVRDFIPGFHFSPDRIAREGVGRSWQDIRLFPTLNLQNNIAVAAPGQLGERVCHALFTPFAVRKAEKTNLEEASQLLETLGLGGRDASSGDRISLGQSKRVAIARAVRGGARVLFLDEPLAGLDSKGVEKLLNFLVQLAKTKGITLVIVEHVFHIQRVLDVADTVWTMRDGKLQVQRPEDLNNHTGELTQEKLSSWVASQASSNDTVKHQTLPGGASLTCAVLPESENNEVVLEVKDLVIHRGRRRVIGWEQEGKIQGLNFSLRRGEIALLQAPNGWGKTTLMDALGGIERVDSGVVRLGGKDLIKVSTWRRRAEGLVYVRALSGGFGNLTVEENLKLSSQNAAGVELANMPLGLTLSREVSSLSGGERRRLIMHGALVAEDVRLFLLDEPFSALDPTRAGHVKTMILELAKHAAVLIAQPALSSGGPEECGGGVNIFNQRTVSL